VDLSVICPDDGPEYTAPQIQVRVALTAQPRTKPEPAHDNGPRPVPDGCN